MTRGVAFVGPLPPPVHGFSSVCALMLERLRTRMPVEVFNRAPKLHARALGALLQLLYPAKYFGMCLARRDVILYLALSGGRGQFIDLIYVLIGKLFRRPIFVHHHSFVYINSPSWLNRCFFALVRNATHIALSPNMGQALVRVYGLNSAAIIVLSHAANYAHEPEPLVIYEAMRQGVHVIACDRGSIAEMLRNGAGLAFTREHIVESAAAHIAKFNDDRHALAAAKRNSMQQALRVRCAGKVALDNLLACMQGTHEPARITP